MKNIFSHKEKITDEEFEKLIKDVQNDLYRIAKIKLKNEDDVMDAIQSTILSAYKNCKQLREKKYFKTWIIRILINQCNQFYNKKKKDMELTKNISSIQENIYEDSFTNNIHSSVDFNLLLKNLSEVEQIVLSLYYSKNYSCYDIAEILDMNVNTVRSHLKRGKDKLKNLYKKGGILGGK